MINFISIMWTTLCECRLSTQNRVPYFIFQMLLILRVGILINVSIGEGGGLLLFSVGYQCLVKIGTYPF